MRAGFLFMQAAAADSSLGCDQVEFQTRRLEVDRLEAASLGGQG